jgi:outer membrane protein assembly factor BamB
MLRDLFYAKGLVWALSFESKPGAGKLTTVKRIFQGLDLQTGAVKKTLPNVDVHTSYGDAPLFISKDYLINKTKINDGKVQNGLVDLESGKFTNEPLLVEFLLDQITANGLIYLDVITGWCGCKPTPHIGLLALAMKTKNSPPSLLTSSQERLEKGPAYGATINRKENSVQGEDWPMYRHDNARSASSSTTLPAQPEKLWSVTVDDQNGYPPFADWGKLPPTYNRITAPVIADGSIFVGSPEAHRVSAFDANTGKPLWTFTAGGLIDSPPTIHQGYCVFGTHDGYVYCLQSSDGKMVWRYRAAPLDKKIAVNGQLESQWPVSGTILVEKNVAYFSAGRVSNYEGGISVHAVDVPTGKLLWTRQTPVVKLQGGEKHRLNTYDAPRNKYEFEGVNDILVSDGKVANLHGWQFNLKDGSDVLGDNRATLLSAGTSPGLLNMDWCFFSFSGSRHVNMIFKDTLGTILAFNRDKILSAEPRIRKGPKLNTTCYDMNEKQLWTLERPARTKLITSMVLTDKHAFLAGADERLKWMKRNYANGFLWVLSMQDGSKVADLKLEIIPVLEGLAVAHGRLYLSTQDGKLHCYGSKQ